MGSCAFDYQEGDPICKVGCGGPTFLPTFLPVLASNCPFTPMMATVHKRSQLLNHVVVLVFAIVPLQSTSS